MGIVYVMSQDCERIWRELHADAGLGPGPVRAVDRPLDRERRPSLWPHGFTDGTSTLWIEGDMLHCWGGQDPRPILRALARQFGVQVKECF